MNHKKSGIMDKIKEKKFIVLGVALLFVLTIIGAAFKAGQMSGMSTSFIEVKESVFSGPKLTAQDLETQVYTEFLCTCCDQPLENCDCGTAQGMRKWMAEQVTSGITMDELLVKASKQFGMKAVESEANKEHIKELLIKDAGKNPPVLEMAETFHELGTIKQSPEKVSTQFEIKNTGKSDLIIDNMDTSCMCTSATITYSGREGPVFGMSMHGNNPKNWQVVIPPGESATLNIYYDPMAHGIQKEEKLDITRFVTISSNDPVNFQEEVKIHLVQVK